MIDRGMETERIKDGGNELKKEDRSRRRGRREISATQQKCIPYLKYVTLHFTAVH